MKNGETVKKITLRKKKLYFVISKSENRIIVKETNADDEEIKLVSNSLKKYFKADIINYLLQSKSTLQGLTKPMVFGFGEKNDAVYMNLFLD